VTRPEPTSGGDSGCRQRIAAQTEPANEISQTNNQQSLKAKGVEDHLHRRTEQHDTNTDTTLLQLLLLLLLLLWSPYVIGQAIIFFAL